MSRNKRDVQAYATGVADQLASALAADDKKAAAAIVNAVAAEHPAAGAALAEEVILHGVRGDKARKGR